MFAFNWGVFWAILAAAVVFCAFAACYNFVQRVRAIRLVSQPFPESPRAQALKTAREKLGPEATVQEIMAEADRMVESSSRSHKRP